MLCGLTVYFVPLFTNLVDFCQFMNFRSINHCMWHGLHSRVEFRDLERVLTKRNKIRTFIVLGMRRPDVQYDLG